MAGSSEADTTPTALHLAASLVRLAGAVGELRQAQQHAAQAAAAKKAAEGLHAALSRSRAGAAALGRPSRARQGRQVQPDQSQSMRRPGDAARHDSPTPLRPGRPLSVDPTLTDPRPSPARSAPSRATARR